MFFWVLFKEEKIITTFVDLYLLVLVGPEDATIALVLKRVSTAGMVGLVDLDICRAEERFE